MILETGRGIDFDRFSDIALNLINRGAIFVVIFFARPLDEFEVIKIVDGRRGGIRNIHRMDGAFIPAESVTAFKRVLWQRINVFDDEIKIARIIFKGIIEAIIPCITGKLSQYKGVCSSL